MLWGFLMKKPEVPMRPPDTRTLRELGQRIAWSTGDEAALHRMRTITREEICHTGLTRDMARSWWQFYKEIKYIFPRNPSASGRSQLLHHIFLELSKKPTPKQVPVM